MIVNRRAAAILVTPLLAALGGCASSEPPVAEIREEFKPVVSLNQVMVAVVDHNAHILWNAAVDDYAPQTESDWHELQHAAVTLAAAGNVILLGGSGPDDLQWVEKPDWPELTQAQTNAALDLLLAVDRRSREELAKAGDALAVACENCHNAHKPDLPSITATPEQQPEHYYGLSKLKGKQK